MQVNRLRGIDETPFSRPPYPVKAPVGVRVPAGGAQPTDSGPADLPLSRAIPTDLSQTVSLLPHGRNFDISRICRKFVGKYRTRGR